MVGMQQFNLRWNNYTANILQVFSDHLSAESLVDVSLSCQGRFVRAHKILLSACSPYFQEVFANHSDKHPVIILKGINYEDLQSLIKFMYTGEIKVLETQLDDLLAAAEMLQVKGLCNVRKKYEKGEITSVNPMPKLVPTQSPDSMTSQTKLPMKAANTTVTLFAPTATSSIDTVPVFAPTTTSSTNPIVVFPTTTTSSTQAIATVSTPPTTTASRARSTNTAKSRKRASNSRITNNNNKAAKSSGSVTAAKASVEDPIVPIYNTDNLKRIAPAPAPVPVPVVPTVTSSVSTTPTTSATVTANSVDPNLTTCLISSTYTTPSVTTPIITCVRGNFVDSNDSERSTDKNSAVPSVTADPALTTNQFLLVSYNTAVANTSGTTTQEEKSVTEKSQPPRIRKRRKMSHTVNELAKETVFTSNGKVLLEPDDAVSKNQSKTPETSVITPAKDVDNTTEDDTITVQKMGRKKRIKKIGQKSLSMKVKDKKTSKIPRPPNAYMIFANEWRRKLALEYPKETNNDISVRLGQMWKGLCNRTTEKYYKLAKKAGEDHKRRYPDYIYSPKMARLRKIQKQNVKITKCSSPTATGSDEPEIIDTYEDDEEREIVEFTDSSDHDDDHDENATLENCEKENEQYDDVVIIDECSVNDDVSLEKCHNRSKRKDATT